MGLRMYDQYFSGWDVRPQFTTEYVSLWSNWLGKEKSHLLDQVTDEEWSRFNDFISQVSQKFRLGIVDCNLGTVTFPAKIADHLSNHDVTKNKNSSQFSKYLIPELECVITEEWDYTYIMWHKNNGAVDALKPFILDARLQHFSD